jgi:hypothetical protein
MKTGNELSAKKILLMKEKQREKDKPSRQAPQELHQNTSLCVRI